MKLSIHSRASLTQLNGFDFAHMISIGDAGSDLTQFRPPGLPASSQLCMNFRDRKTRERADAPTEDDIRPMFLWLDAMGEIDAMLVHCGAGMSRSPAIALLALCHINPNTSVYENMCLVADCAVAKYIWPNALVVELGDDILRRDGEIVSGVNQWRRTIEPEIGE